MKTVRDWVAEHPHITDVREMARIIVAGTADKEARERWMLSGCAADVYAELRRPDREVQDASFRPAAQRPHKPPTTQIETAGVLLSRPGRRVENLDDNQAARSPLGEFTRQMPRIAATTAEQMMAAASKFMVTSLDRYYEDVIVDLSPKTLNIKIRLRGKKVVTAGKASVAQLEYAANSANRSAEGHRTTAAFWTAAVRISRMHDATLERVAAQGHIQHRVRLFGEGGREK